MPWKNLDIPPLTRQRRPASSVGFVLTHASRHGVCSRGGFPCSFASKFRDPQTIDDLVDERNLVFVDVTNVECMFEGFADEAFAGVNVRSERGNA